MRQAKVKKPQDSKKPTEVCIGPYRLSKKLGQGSFAGVWLARRTTDKEVFSIKVISKEKIIGSALEHDEEFLRNARHPNLVEFHEVITTPKYVAIVMEYCEGGDLASYLKKHGALPEDTVRHLMRQFAAGLGFLWEKRLMHRDLKPHNLLLKDDSKTPILKIADFGLARFVSDETIAYTLCGTPLYTAPEILVGNNRYDETADLWSVGAIMYEMLAARPLLSARLVSDIIRRHITNDDSWIAVALASLPPDTTPVCRDLLSALLKPRPSDRASFAAFLRHPFLRDDGLAALLHALLLELKAPALHSTFRPVIRLFRHMRRTLLPASQSSIATPPASFDDPHDATLRPPRAAMPPPHVFPI